MLVYNFIPIFLFGFVEEMMYNVVMKYQSELDYFIAVQVLKYNCSRKMYFEFQVRAKHLSAFSNKTE